MSNHSAILSPRWQKVVRDLLALRTRGVMIVLAIALSLAGFSGVMNAYAILTRELSNNYLGTNPASATLVLENISDALVQQVGELSSVQAAEARRTVLARVQTGDNEWKPLTLFVIPDFGSQKVSTFTRESGAFPPATGEVVVERSALPVIEKMAGDTLNVRVPGGLETSLKLTGIVHDPGQAPGWMDGVAVGYVTPETLVTLGFSTELSELKIIGKDVSTTPQAEANAQEVSAWLESEGQSVSRIEVPPYSKHPHQDQMNALLVLLGVFSLLALVLSGVLTANMIAALLAQQVRQIGVMKAIGGRTSQLTLMYLVMVGVLAGAATIIGLVAGAFIARYGALQAANLLNFDIASYAVPHTLVMLELTVGLLIPLFVALFPILRGSRVTVRQAINDYGVNANSFGKSWLDKLLSRFRGLSRPVALALRNTFRQGERLTLTLVMLAVSGAMFTSAANVSAAWNKTLGAAFERRAFDVDVRLEQSQTNETLDELLASIPEIKTFESWGYVPAALVHEGETDMVRTYPGGTHGGLVLVAPPDNSQLIQPLLLEGRWLEPADTNGVVVNAKFLQDEAEYSLGSEIKLATNGRETTWQIIGVIRELGAPATIYASREAFNDTTGLEDRSSSLRIVTEDSSAATQAEVARSLEQTLAEANVNVSSLLTSSELKNSFNQHIVILVTALLVMAGVIASVGGLGLASTMSVNILERTREFGVMRTLGAKSNNVLSIVITEGVTVGLLSFPLAFLLSLPLSLIVGIIAGQVGLQAPLVFALSPLGLLAWLLLVILLAALSSALPALSASRLTVRETLAYQ
jgi:putative ABC transport system permease protein